MTFKTHFSAVVCRAAARRYHRCVLPVMTGLEARMLLSAPPAGAQIVDSMGDVGQYTSIALDSAGAPGISYFDKTNGSLKFARWANDHWESQKVVAGLVGPAVGQGTSLQFDTSDHPVIAFYNQGSKDLQLASWTGASWTVETVDSAGDVGRYPSLALDAGGNPHISYFGNATLKYAERTGGVWHIETAAQNSDPMSSDVVGLYTSLKLDGTGLPHIGFFDAFSPAYATRSSPSGPWSVQFIPTDPFEDGGYGTSLALDLANHPHLSYIRAGRAFRYDVAYTVSNGAAGWTSHALLSGPRGLPTDGDTTSIVLDQSGKPVIIHSDGTRLVLSTSQDGGATFEDEAIDGSGGNLSGQSVGIFNSMVVAPNGVLNISYYDERNGDLKFWSGKPAGAFLSARVNDIAYAPDGTLHMAFYRESGKPFYATRAPDGIWSATELVDVEQRGDGAYLSISVDASGRPGIAYYDSVNGDLKYASRNASGSWEVQVVDSQRTTGLYPSLAFGRSGRPVISYYYATRGELRLAAQGRGGWSIQTIDADDDAGRFSSLAVDPLSGRWDIGYVSEKSGHAKIQLARQTRSGWALQTADRLPGSGGFVSLAFAPSGLPAISYYNAQKADLKFAAFDGKKWHPTTVASSRSQGLYSSLLYENSDPVIVYYNRTNDTLNTARRDKSGKWNFAVPLGGGRYTSAAAGIGGGYSYSRIDPDTENLLIEDVM